MLKDFVAIDVETANRYPTSICAIGAVKVVDGLITDRFYELVKPVPNYYYRYFTEQIHGIGAKDTANARTFGEVWSDLMVMAGSLPMVAHNKAFDEKCLRAACLEHGIAWHDPEFMCTLTASRRAIPKAVIGSHSLPVVADWLGIPFKDHHNALADAECCARIALAVL